MCVIRLGF